MSKLPHAHKGALNQEGNHAIEEQFPELLGAIKLMAPTLNNAARHQFNLKVASVLQTLKAEKEAIGLKEYHRQANEEHFPELIEAILKLRPVLSHFRDHKFKGVPLVRKQRGSKVRKIWDTKQGSHSTFYSSISMKGQWVDKLGFKEPGYIQVLALNGLLIICPEIIHEYTEPKRAKRIPIHWLENYRLMCSNYIMAINRNPQMASVMNGEHFLTLNSMLCPNL